MNRTLSITILALSAAPLLAPAQTLLLSDSFDSYANQAAFEAVWTPIGSTAPISGTLNSDQYVSPLNSIRIDGATVNSQQRNRATFAESGLISTGNSVAFSFDFYDSNTSATYRQYANLHDSTSPSGTGQLISLGLNNNQTGTQSGGNYYMARILGYTVPTTADPDGGAAESVGGAGTYFKLNDFGVGLRSVGWHNLKVEITTDDGASLDFAFYVDGMLAERVNNIGTASSLRSYDNVALGSGLSNGSNAAYYDNVLVMVPEPTTAALLGVGLSALVALRRARR